MAAFAESGTYLKFSERPRSNSRSVLWPVLVHRVLYPEPRQPQLNLFQRAVLGLIRASSVRQDAVANLTGLHPELIALIVAQGISSVWLTATGDELTEKGQRLLDDEEDEFTNLKAGYLLQDAVTGEFWPRMVTKLEQIETVDSQAKFPRFAIERKTGQTFSPFCARAKKLDLPTLNNDLLARAYSEYQKDYRANQQLGGMPAQIPQVRLQGVQRLDELPEAARIVVWVTGDDEGDELWSIKDPFGLRESAWWLEDALTQLLDSDKKLQEYLAPLVGIHNARDLTYDQWLKEIQKKTDLDILIEFPWVERQPDIRRYFARLLKWRNKIEQGAAEYSDFEAAIGDCQKLLEVVMQWLIKTYPANVGQIPKPGKPDWGLNERLLRALGIPSFNDQVTRSLARQNIQQVIRACQNPSSSLKALLFAAGMGVLAEDQHPLKLLSDGDLQLEKLLKLADLRNQTSHGQSSFNKRNIDELSEKSVIENIEYAKNFTECFKDRM